MDLYNYLSVLTSVVLGLGLCKCLTNLSRIVKQRLSSKVVYPQLLWLSYCIILHVLYWWSFWDFRKIVEWNFFSFIYVLIGPILLFLVSDTLLKDAAEETETSEEYFFSQHRWIFGGFLTLQVWGTFLSPLLLNLSLFRVYSITQVVMALIFITGIWTSHKKIHLLLAIGGLSVVLAHIVIFRLILAL